MVKRLVSCGQEEVKIIFTRSKCHWFSYPSLCPVYTTNTKGLYMSLYNNITTGINVINYKYSTKKKSQKKKKKKNVALWFMG